MAIEMSEFGHRMVERRVRKANPNLSTSALKMLVLRAYYADCYSDEEFRAIEKAWETESRD